MALLLDCTTRVNRYADLMHIIVGVKESYSGLPETSACNLQVLCLAKVCHDGAEKRSQYDRMKAALLHERWRPALRGRVTGSALKLPGAAWG